MLTTSVLPWLRNRRLIALLAAAALAASLAFAMIGNSWTSNAAVVSPTVPSVDQEVVAGPSWTLSVRIPGPVLSPISVAEELKGSIG
jgi:hypothetical protein